MAPEMLMNWIKGLNASDLADELDNLGPLLERLWIAAKWQCHDHPEDTEQGLLNAVQCLEHYGVE